MRSSPEFDLVLEMPKAANKRERLIKENIELEKVIANSDRQLGNEDIIGKMPATRRRDAHDQARLAYKAQLKKNLDALANRMTFDITHPDVRAAVERALSEDLGSGDITTNSCIPADAHAEARFVAKQDMTVAGVELLALLFDSSS